MVIEENELNKILKMDNKIFNKEKWTRDHYVHSKTFVIDNVGFISYLPGVDSWDIMRIGVYEEQRRCGHGERMLKHIIEINDGKDIFLEVNTNNLAAIALYNKLGFKSLRIRQNYYKDHDALVMKYTK